MTQITIDQALQLAVGHCQAGRPAEAEQICRQILAQQPDHAVALHLLGMVATRVGQLDAAIELIQRSVRINPNDADAHNSLGIALQNKGQLDAAVAAYREAIRANHEVPEAHNNLGNLLQAKGRLDEAVAAYREAIRIRPDYAEAHNNLANAYQGQGRFDDAVAAARRAIQLNPALPQAHNNLGNALKSRGQLEEAATAYCRAIQLKPDYAQAHNNLGVALKNLGKLEAALAAYRLALQLKPDDAAAHSNLGSLLQSMGRLDEAIAAYQQAIALTPENAEAQNNLGNALKDKGRLDDALAAFGQAIALTPAYMGTYNNLGIALKDAGQVDEAIAAFRQGLALDPRKRDTDDNLLYTLPFHPDYDAAAILAESRRWNDIHARPLAAAVKPHDHDRSPNRPLRIGYVSGDFRRHVVARNFLPLLKQHDRSQFSVFCYSNTRRPDDFTQRLRGFAAEWRDIYAAGDDEAAEIIRADRIDILVDCSLHMSDNRLAVFARKPAPVQATWLGYPGTTGMDAIDYRLTDPYLDPPGQYDADYSERSIRLPDTFWCYDAIGDDAAIPPAPSMQNGFITFGCLNNFCKINDQVLALWAKVTTQVAGSRLLLWTPPGSSRNRVLNRLSAGGVGADRVQFVTRMARPQYLRTYHRIDIALDTFPYNGHTTSLDSLWMGVPVITLAGKTVVGRAGVSQLSNVGLPELIANDAEQFVTIAAHLAADTQRLAELRRTLRARMQASPLMDAPRWARGVEAAYRRMWQAWCAAER